MQQSPDGFLAAHKARSGAGVLVLHAWWGLNQTMRGVCTRLADAGYVAFAPDLYHGKLATTVPEAEALVKELNADEERATAEIGEAARYVQEHAASSAGGIAVVGFSLGAYLALELAASKPEIVRSVVLFYGTGGGDFSASLAEFQGHFAADDPFEPRAGVDELEQALRDAGRPVTFHHYPGTGHWFFEPDRADAYNAAAASLAWERTLAFLGGR